jgi:hypothetical protein
MRLGIFRKTLALRPSSPPSRGGVYRRHHTSEPIRSLILPGTHKLHVSSSLVLLTCPQGSELSEPKESATGKTR